MASAGLPLQQGQASQNPIGTNQTVPEEPLTPEVHKAALTARAQRTHPSDSAWEGWGSAPGGDPC